MQMDRDDGRGAVRVYRYVAPMADEEELLEVVARLRELPPDDREIAVRLIRHLAELRTLHKK